MPTKLNREIVLFILTIIISAVTAFAGQVSPDNVWEQVDRSDLQQRGIDALPLPAAYETFSLNKTALEMILSRAPEEFAPGQAVILTLPMPDGSFERFEIEHSLVVERGLLEKYPELGSTYRARGIDDPTAYVRFDFLPSGFHAMVLSSRGTLIIDPYRTGDTDHYISYFKREQPRVGDWQCFFHESGPDGMDEVLRPQEFDARGFLAGGDSPDVTSGSQLRTYRLALAANNEYCVAVGQNTVAGSLAAQVLVMNRVNGVYERDVAIHMNIIGNNNLIVYAGDNMTCPVPGGNQSCNSGNDPYSNDTGALGQNTPNLNTVIGSANYDIGHVFTTGSGGVAQLNSPCGSSKGAGTTGLPNPIGDPFAIDFVAHEMGHQWGGFHTFNGTTSNCGGGNRSGSAAYEVGSGITVMAYAGICGSENLALNSIDTFHVKSLEQIVSFSQNGNGNTCAATTASGNTPPTVSVVGGPTFNIPKTTPFILTASATDPNTGDSLTYDWQEYDLGPQSPPHFDTDGLARPLFRPYLPLTSGSRTYPSLQFILNNANVPPQMTGSRLTGERLPSIARTMRFQVVVRDNHAGTGGINTADAFLNIDANSGPFAVTSPNGGESLAGGNLANITWDVANTNNPPVSAGQVNILMSTDGGNTFPTTLASGVPNNGSAFVIIPNGLTTTARVKVAAVGNIFFDISNGNFSVVAGGGTPSPIPTPSPFTPSPTPTPTPSPCVPNYTTTTGTGTITAGGTDIGNHCDDCATQITLPFSVNAYGTPTTVAYAGSNGTLQLTNTPNLKPFYFMSCLPVIPDQGGPFVNTMFLYYDDLRTDVNPLQACADCGIFTQTVGSAPNRQFIVRYKTTYFNHAGTAEFQAVLNEGSDTLSVIYGASNNNGLEAASGIQRDVTVFNSFSCNQNTLTSGLRVNYVATCPAGTPGPSPTPSPTPTPTPSPSPSCPPAVSTFNATNVPAEVPDNDPAGVNINIPVSGLTSNLVSVRVQNMTWNPEHSWGGDIVVVLRAPGGSPSATIHQRRGQTTCGTGFGSNADLVGPYTFGDAFATNFHTVAGDPVPAASYRATRCTGTPGELVNLDTIFAGLPPGAANGTWTLNVSDNAADDTGTVSAVQLWVQTAVSCPSPSPSANPTPTPSPGVPQHFLDFNGDARTDFAVTRSSGGLKTWYVALSGSTSFIGSQWGIATDHEVPADYDGDSRTDIAVFRDTEDPARAHFYIFRSSNATVQIQQFGRAGDGDDVARVIGDWDGDGTDDVAVLRHGDNLPCGAGRSVFYWRPSGSPGTDFVYTCWGLDTDAPYAGDFDGDGRMDAGVIRRPGGQNTVYIRRSSDGNFEAIPWGNLGDTYFPCDYDGDAKSDICLVRVNGANAEFYVLTRTGGGTGASPIIFNNINKNSDQLAFGEFDGDGRTDIGILHPSGGNTTFIYRRSTNGTIGYFPWGLTGDHSVAESFAGGSGN